MNEKVHLPIRVMRGGAKQKVQYFNGGLFMVSGKSKQKDKVKIIYLSIMLGTMVYDALFFTLLNRSPNFLFFVFVSFAKGKFDNCTGHVVLLLEIRFAYLAILLYGVIDLFL